MQSDLVLYDVPLCVTIELTLGLVVAPQVVDRAQDDGSVVVEGVLLDGIPEVLVQLSVDGQRR